MNNYKIKVLVAAIIAASYTGSCYAAEMTNQQIQALVNQVVAQKTQGLQQEVGQLKAEVVGLKQQLRSTGNATKATVKYRRISIANIPSASAVNPPRPSTAAKTGTAPTIGSGYHANHSTRANHKPINIPWSNNVFDNAALTRIYLGGTPVFSSPYIGEHSTYDGSDLIVNQSTVNLDTRLLKQGQALDDELADKGLPAPDHPVVEVSGEVEPIAFVAKQSPGNTQADTTLSDAELDVYAQADPWVFGYMSFAWNDVLNSPYRVSNAVTTVDKAFVTIGNLSKCPVYSSIGQLYVPFGQYNSYMISSPLTELMARTKARAAVLGWYPQGDTGVFASTYVFKSDTIESDKSAAGGANLGYNYDIHNISGSLATGVISNIADSQGMQENAAPRSIPFSGFAMNSDAERIVSAVPAVDMNGTANYGNWNLVGEYVDTTTTFNPRAMTFNGAPARPSAGQVEGAYTFTIHGKPGNIALGYDWTRDGLALLLPRQRYTTTVNYSFWRDTMESLEFRHDINYGSDSVATGANSRPFNPLNKYVNMVTAQIAVFF